MREHSPAHDGGLSPEEGRRGDTVCDRFEAEWKAGRRPRVEHYLEPMSQPARAELLRELLALERDYRSRSGEEPSSEEYCQRFPEDAALVGSVFQETTLFGPPPRKSLLPHWLLSRLVRQKQAMALSGTASADYAPNLFWLWSRLIRPAPAESTDTPEPGAAASVPAEISTVLLRPGAGQSSGKTEEAGPTGDE